MCIYIHTDPLKKTPLARFQDTSPLNTPGYQSRGRLCSGSRIISISSLRCDGRKIDEDAGLYKSLAAGLKETCLRFAGPAFPLHNDLCFSKVIKGERDKISRSNAVDYSTSKSNICLKSSPGISKDLPWSLCIIWLHLSAPLLTCGLSRSLLWLSILCTRGGSAAPLASAQEMTH